MPKREDVSNELKIVTVSCCLRKKDADFIDKIAKELKVKKTHIFRALVKELQKNEKLLKKIKHRILEELY